MVIKGKSVAGGGRLAAHLGRTDTNERMQVVELRDVAAEDLRGALHEMEALASACPNCQKPFYHASINTRADEHLTPEQRMASIDRLEEKLGLTGQPRAVVAHVKEGRDGDLREHYHIVWSRIDLDRMRVISDSHNYRTHELVARALEREFGHARVQGAHVERDGQARPERTPSHKEMQQGERTGISPQQAKELMTELWRSTDNGQAFQAALEEKGWSLARGDRRDFVAVDPQGGTHSLARRIEGAKAKDVRERLADLDPLSLPSVAEAKAMAQGMGRVENKRDATADRIDNDAAVRAELEKTVAVLADPRSMPRSPARASSAGQATTAAPVAAAKDRPQAARQAPAQKETGSAAGSVARGAKRFLSGLAEGILKALMGESPAPPPTSHEQGQAPPAPEPERRRPTLQEYEQDMLLRMKAMQALGRVAGREVISEADFRMQQETEKKRERDRGGGQSL